MSIDNKSVIQALCKPGANGQPLALDIQKTEELYKHLRVGIKPGTLRLKVTTHSLENMFIGYADLLVEIPAIGFSTCLRGFQVKVLGGRPRLDEASELLRNADGTPQKDPRNPTKDRYVPNYLFQNAETRFAVTMRAFEIPEINGAWVEYHDALVSGELAKSLGGQETPEQMPAPAEAGGSPFAAMLG